MRALNRNAVLVTQKQPFLEWLPSTDSTSQDLTLADLCVESTIYLLPESGDDQEAARFLRRVCNAIFEEELNGWYRVPEVWPEDRSFGAFEQWFDYQFHSMGVDICNARLIAEEM